VCPVAVPWSEGGGNPWGFPAAKLASDLSQGWAPLPKTCDPPVPPGYSLIS